MSALAAIQGARVRVVDVERECVGATLDGSARAELGADDRRSPIADHAASPSETDDAWSGIFPMVLPPAGTTASASSR